MNLALEIEYLTGVAFAAIGPDSDAPDWPPQPDRVFSALVATWAARGEPADERQALEWLEALPQPPAIVASDAQPRTAPISFVPPNDPESGRQGNPQVMPALRRRQARRFPGARPHDPVVRLLWKDAAPDSSTMAALERLAADTSYVGHSTSLTRCRFMHADDDAVKHSRPPKRRVYRGRLTELRRAFDARTRPMPGASVRAPERAAEHLPQSTFDSDWLILEHVGGDMPDVRASALVGKTIRDTLLSGYEKAELGVSIPEIVSGHAHDGSRTAKPHLAIVPLAFAGFPHADGRVLGFGLVPPRGSGLLEDTNFRRALRKVASFEDNAGDGQRRRIIHVRRKAEENRPPVRVAFSLSLDLPDRASLDPHNYTTPARIFATVTPILLDRHLKEKGAAREEETVEQIVAACRNINLPEPTMIRHERGDPYRAVFPDKHSSVAGAPSAEPSGKSPAWMRWQLPKSLASRSLTHAVIVFEKPVQGPVILGAGRFVGLGLCRPLPDPQEPR